MGTSGVKKMFCWQCGKPLNYRHGQPMFEVVSVDGNDVKVHKICKQGALNYQKLDTTPDRGSFEPRKVGGQFHEFTKETFSKDE